MATEDGLRFQQDYVAFMSDLPGDLADRFAGVRIDIVSQTAHVFFKGPAPAGLVDRAREAGLSLDITGDREFSLMELQRMQRTAHDSLLAGGYPGVATSLDLDSQAIRISVGVDPSTDERAAQSDALTHVRAALQRAGNERLPEVSVQVLGGPVFTTPTHTYGGAQFRDDGVNECTSAFSVENGANDGVLTASHCEGLNEIVEHYSGGGTYLVYSAPWASEHIGWNGDIEWHTTVHTEYPQFWSNYSYLRNVTGRLANTAIAEDMAVCKFGRVGGYDCGQVENVSITISFQWEGCGGCTRNAYNMVEARNVSASLGDSGGPVFASTTAYGIIHGFITANGHLVYSPIQRAEQQFGVTVMTQ